MAVFQRAQIWDWFTDTWLISRQAARLFFVAVVFVLALIPFFLGFVDPAKISPRRRNLWVTDTLQWAPEARLAQPANPMWDSAASAFPVRSQLPFELVCPLR